MRLTDGWIVFVVFIVGVYLTLKFFWDVETLDAGEQPSLIPFAADTND